MVRLAAAASLLTTVALLIGTPISGQEGLPAPGAGPGEDPSVSPRGAFFRSFVLPGWGQAYVGSPGRGALYFSLAGGSVWMSFEARRQLRDARIEQAWQRDTGQLEPAEESEFAVARARHFEDWVALSLFLFFFSAADAYVGAYLADFDERVGAFPGSDGAVTFEARIPVGRAR